MLSHALVVTASIALVLMLSLVLIRRYETRVEIERLASIARPLAVRTNIERLADEGFEADAIRRLRTNRLDDQAAALGVRLLVLDSSGIVVHDTAVNATLDDGARQRLAGLAGSLREQAPTSGRRQISLGPRSERSPFPGDVVIVSTVRGSRSGDVLILVSARDRYPLLRRALGPLALITVASLVVAVGTGLLLSRRIARPVERLTGAIDAMAAGGLNQRVVGEGPDELGRLVGSFNAMSGRVATLVRSQRDLLANVAHELRTPLTSIRGFSQAMVDGVIQTDGDRERALATIGRETDRMSRLIAQLLDLARIEAGAIAIQRQPVSIRPLLDEVVSRFSQKASERGVELVVERASEIVVPGDRERLVQVVSNLVANALAHTPAGGTIQLAAVADRHPDGRALVNLTVSDTGSGIAPEQLDRVFERFVGGDGSTGGFGLGLSIVRELVSLHGGKIDAESTVGAGTRFTITLPAEDSIDEG